MQWLALLGLSIAFNLMATALIAGRTIRARSRDSKIRGGSDTFSTDLQGDRSGLRSILVEAAVPLAICGMRTAVLQGLTSHYIGADAATQTRIMVAGIAASTLYTASVVRVSWLASDFHVFQLKQWRLIRSSGLFSASNPLEVHTWPMVDCGSAKDLDIGRECRRWYGGRGS